MKIPTPNQPGENVYHSYMKKIKGVSYYYNTVNQTGGLLNKAHEKWRKHVDGGIEIEEFKTLFSNLYKVTNNVKLRSFQYRMLHSAIVTKQHLFRWKITKNNLCYFCKEEKETITHLMYNCIKIQPVWKFVEKICDDISHTEECHITEKSVMSNMINRKPEHIFNFICLVTKQFIYASKCCEKQMSNTALKEKICKYKNFELFQAKSEN